jgi:hypothetical protein
VAAPAPTRLEPRRNLPLVLALFCGQVCGPDSQAAALTGEIPKADFRTWSTRHGGVWLDFNDLLAGTPVKDQWAARHGLSFTTTHNPAGQALPPGTPVLASTAHAYNAGRITLVGSSAPPTAEDHNAPYEIRFARPQRWAGIHRHWRGPTLTRFHSPTGDILHEARGEGFQAWISETADTNSWVARIEITGELREDLPQVGHSDDLVFGTQDIPRNLPYLSLRSLSAAISEIGPTPRIALDYRLRRGAITNEAFLSTNSLPGKDGPDDLGIYLDLSEEPTPPP